MYVHRRTNTREKLNSFAKARNASILDISDEYPYVSWLKHRSDPPGTRNLLQATTDTQIRPALQLQEEQ